MCDDLKEYRQDPKEYRQALKEYRQDPKEYRQALKEYQQDLLEMLLRFDEFCKAHHLRYFLAGGSALGAVRHQGFIPWDDDVDLAMLRPDFERLEALMKEQGNRIPGSDYYYSPVLAQIVPDAPIGHLFYLPGGVQAKQPSSKRDGNQAKQPGSKRAKQQDGTKHLPYSPADAPMLDIHPIDGVPRLGVMRKVQRFFAIVHYMAVYRLPTKNKGRLAHAISGLLVKITPDFLFDWYARISRKIITAWRADRAEYVCSLFGLAGYEHEVMKRDLLVPYQDVPFEGYRLPIPAKQEAYLQRLYGDYKTLPPKDGRKPKHTGYIRFIEAKHSKELSNR